MAAYCGCEWDDRRVGGLELHLELRWTRTAGTEPVASAIGVVGTALG